MWTNVWILFWPFWVWYCHFWVMFASSQEGWFVLFIYFLLIFSKVWLIYTLMKVSHEKTMWLLHLPILTGRHPYPNAVAVHQFSKMPQIHYVPSLCYTVLPVIPHAMCTKHNRPQSPSPSLPTCPPTTPTLAASFHVYWILFLYKNLVLILLILFFNFVFCYSVFSMSFYIQFWFSLLFPF